MKGTRLLPSLLGGLVFLALGAFVATRFRLTTDLQSFLPTDADRSLHQLSSQLMRSELSRTLVLVLHSRGDASITAASRALEASLRADPPIAARLAFVQGGPPEELDRAFWQLYRAPSLGFLAPTEEEARQQLSATGLRQAAARLHAAFAGSMSPLVRQIASEDPLLTLPTLMRRFAASYGRLLSVRDGRFVTADGRHAVLFVGTRASAFDAAAQRPFLQGLQRLRHRLQKSYGGQIELEFSGLHRFTVHMAQAIERDIQRVSWCSLLFLLAMFLGLFRSPRLLLLAMLPLTFGTLAGCAAVLTIFGRLHGITLAFGASLLGVSIDYVVHLTCQHALVAPAGGPLASLAAVRRPLTLGVATTLIGFLALGASSLAGLREVACFSVAGIFAAFLTTLTLLPPWLPQRLPEVATRRHLASWLRRAFALLMHHRTWCWLPAALALALMALAAPRLHWQHGFAAMQQLDPDLLAADQRVRRLLPMEQNRFVVAIGRDDEAALQANERAFALLQQAAVAGELQGFRNVATLLPSARRQRRIAALARDDASLPARLTETFAAAGFRPDAFAAFSARLAAPAATPLTYAQLSASPLASLVRPFRVQLPGRVVFLSFLHGVGQPDTLAKRLHSVADVSLFRSTDLAERTDAAYQRSTLRFLALGLLAVLTVLGLGHRRWRPALASFVPSLLAAGLTVALLTLRGHGIDLVILTALLLVVSMGVDYGVFLVDAWHAEDDRQLGAALASIFLATLSTVVGFGLLAFSAHPVLASLGWTAAIGVTASLVFAPTTLLLLHPRKKPDAAR